MAFSKDILQIKDVQNIKKSLEDFGSLDEDVMGNQTHSDGLS